VGLETCHLRMVQCLSKGLFSCMQVQTTERLPDNVYPYFMMPENYHGNQLKSYGGYLKYTVRHEGQGHPISAPDVILTVSSLQVIQFFHTKFLCLLQKGAYCITGNSKLWCQDTQFIELNKSLEAWKVMYISQQWRMENQVWNKHAQNVCSYCSCLSPICHSKKNTLFMLTHSNL
jgi:hypothetical protein